MEEEFPPRVFSEQDYDSNDGMMTSIWGPTMWHSLHCVSFNYPVHPSTKQKKDHATFIFSLGQILPCRYCRENFQENILAVGIHNNVFKSRDAFSRFVYRLHEHVNMRLGKTSGLSYTDVRDRYEAFRSRCLNGDSARPPPRSSDPEQGCVEPMYEGKKSKCVLRIVPKESRRETFAMHPRCQLKKSGRGSGGI
jgi:hypothetical protein